MRLQLAKQIIAAEWIRTNVGGWATLAEWMEGKSSMEICEWAENLLANMPAKGTKRHPSRRTKRRR